MADILFISLGAILGANARFEIYNKLNKLKLRKDLYAFLINTFASFFFGFFLAIFETFGSFIYSCQLVLFFSIGFLGSLSTFSGFVYDLFDLCLHFKYLRAIKLLIISLSTGILAFALGFLLGN